MRSRSSCKTSRSSPRSWRCFQALLFQPQLHQVFSTLVEVFLNFFHRVTPIMVFSTLVEVFPPEELSGAISNSLLHARGGVSRSR